MMKHDVCLPKNMVNKDACDLVDYDRSESAEFYFPPKRWMFQSGFFIGCLDGRDTMKLSGFKMKSWWFWGVK